MRNAAGAVSIGVYTRRAATPIQGETDVRCRYTRCGLFFCGVILAFASAFPHCAGAAELSTQDGVYLRFRGMTAELLSFVNRSEHVPLKFITESYPTFSITDYTARERSGRIPTNLKEADENVLVINGQSDELDVEMLCKLEALSDHMKFSIELLDTSGEDRAVTLRYQMPVTAEGWRWWDDVATSRVIEPGKRYVRYQDPEKGIFPLWWYPLGSISEDEGHALTLAVPMDPPTLARVGYDGDFFIEFDLGLSPATTKFPGRADLTFYLYSHDAEWGFRSALKKYYDLFPQYFVKRVQREGLWLARTPTQVVSSPEEFGITFHEVSSVKTNPMQLDNAMGIYTFSYIEPGRAGISLPFGEGWSDQAARDSRELTPEEFRTKYEKPTWQEVIEKVEEFAADPESEQHLAAQRVLAFASRNRGGRYYLTVGQRTGVGWRCTFSAATDPEMVVPGTEHTVLDEWRQSQLARLLALYDGRYDGQYVDSSEYLADTLNFRRDHFPYADYPLGFDPGAGKPAIVTGTTRYEYFKAISEDLHRNGKLMMANGTPIRFGFFAHLLDVLGSEAWHDENYSARRLGESPRRGDSSFAHYRDWKNESGMYCRRALIYQKPFCLLLKLNGAEAVLRFEEEYMDTFMDWCLFFGVYPTIGGMWEDPEPQRELYRKYMPVFRALGTAGWEPVTHTRTDNPDLRVERYGYWVQGTLHFAVRNFGESDASGNLVIDAGALLIGEEAIARDAFTGEELEWKRDGDKAMLPLTLSPARTAVIHVSAEVESRETDE